MKKLLELDKTTIQGILSDAVDNGEWHTPSVEDLWIDEEVSDNTCITGHFKTSLHSTYRSLKRQFQINEDSVRIWENRQEVGALGNLKTKRHYRPIYNIIRIAKVLESIEDVPQQH